MSEEQAFFALSTLCDRLVPGYYSTTMYGTLLDQRVFESLVEKTMPILWEHLVKADVQLSVVSLPWFLSLYINSMPLVFAFRVLDVFFLEGPKVLFQIGLAILRINGEELLDATDDGAFISILKSYFSRLDESAHPRSDNEKLRAVTRFQELMVVAFKEFSGITAATVQEQRTKHKDGVMSSIESFAKRTQLRNLGPESKRLKPDELSAVYDRYHSTIYGRQLRLQRVAEELERHQKKRGASSAASIKSTATGPLGSSVPSPVTTMDYDTFREFLAGVTQWAIADPPPPPPVPELQPPKRRFGPSPEPADHEFLQRLFGRWDTDMKSTLSLTNIVTGLADVVGKRKDLMSTIAYWFELYDDDGDGRVDREGILRISEALLFVTRRSEEERVLGAVSGFIRRCFEYADPDRNRDQLIPISPKEEANVALNPQRPLHITLPTFRMVILADETLENFFDTGFADSFNLLSTESSPVPPTAAGYLPSAKGIRGVLDGLVDEATKMAVEVRKRIDLEQDEEDEADGEREKDSELLKGADAEAGVVVVEAGRQQQLVVGKTRGEMSEGKRSISHSGAPGNGEGGKGVVEFEG